MLTDVFIWWAWLQVFGLLALPTTLWLFRGLPDGGYAFSKSFGLLLVGYVAWLLAMLGLVSFGNSLLLVLLLALGAGGAVMLVRGHGVPLVAVPATVRGVLRQHWRGVLAYELLFVGAMLALAWVRGHSLGFVGPHPWGTERPMDFAFFNAIRYSPVFPPHDPWLAGYSINYYYFGYLLQAMVASLSGLQPAVAYNLALIGTFALTALGVAGIVSNLVTLFVQQHADGQPVPVWSWGRGAAAALGVVLVLLVGNQAGALQVIVGDNRVVALDGQQLVAAVSQAVTSDTDEITLPYPAHTTDFDTFETLQRTDRWQDFDWWWASRAVWDAAPAPDAALGVPRHIYNITEFPFFSFWLGDMHPHVMALPFNVLALALVLVTLTRPTLPDFRQRGQGWLLLFLTGLILGSLYTTNSWDLPTYVLLYGGALLLVAVRAGGGWVAVAWRRLALAGGLAFAALIGLFLPFHLTFRSLVGFAEPLVDFPVIGRLTTMLAPFVADKTDLHELLIMFGLFVLPLGLFVYLQPDGSTSRLVRVLVGPAAAVVVLLVGVLAGFPLLAVAVVGCAATYRAVQHAAQPATVGLLLMIAMGCAILFGTELIYLRDVFSNRMNTVFKFYYQVWLLWGTGAAVAVWWVLDALPRLGGVRRGVAVATLGVTLLLLLGGLVYPYINVRDVAQRGTWEGLAGRTPRENVAAEAQALRWLRDETPPGSVVLEMVGPNGGSYNGEGYSGVSAATGRPTVLGWVGHQSQWRGGDEQARAELAPRQSDVERLYATTDLSEARALIERYNVRYVYVGGLEQQAFDPTSLAKFAVLGTPVFQQDGVTIYEINPASPDS